MNTLRKFRKNEGLTQMELAKKIGISQGIISKVENGELNPCFRMIKMLRKKFKICANEFLDKYRAR